MLLVTNLSQSMKQLIGAGIVKEDGNAACGLLANYF